MGVCIDKSSVVAPGAELGTGCIIGPFCTIGPNTKIGERTHLHSHVVVDGYTELGADCTVFPFVTLGVQSQDQKHIEGTKTFTKIGDRNTIREYVSIHSATEEQGVTEVGNDCALLAHSHVAHNCKVGNHVIMSHAATLGGHVVIGEYANIGGLSAVHQFCHVGRAAMVGGMARVTQDVLPFTIAEGFRATMRVVNKIGMERAGYDTTAIREVRLAFRTLFMREFRLEEAVAEVTEKLGHRDYIRIFLDAIASSQRGLARPDSDALEINTDT